MKKFSAFMAIWLILLSLVYLLHSEDNQQDKTEKSVAEIQINSLYEKYGERLFRCFYSIDELRPFSIVQVDKIVEIYDGKWLSPQIILSKLTTDDKLKLKASIIDYINSFSDNNKRMFIIARIISWCKADLQLNFMNQELGIHQDNIIVALNQTNYNRQIVNKNMDLKTATLDSLNMISSDYSYYQTLNLISSLSVPDQLKYYGDVFNQLALLSNK
jgi:hypothetical protein